MNATTTVNSKKLEQLRKQLVSLVREIDDMRGAANIKAAPASSKKRRTYEDFKKQCS